MLMLMPMPMLMLMLMLILMLMLDTHRQVRSLCNSVATAVNWVSNFVVRCARVCTGVWLREECVRVYGCARSVFACAFGCTRRSMTFLSIVDAFHELTGGRDGGAFMVYAAIAALGFAVLFFSQPETGARVY